MKSDRRAGNVQKSNGTYYLSHSGLFSMKCFSRPIVHLQRFYLIRIPLVRCGLGGAWPHYPEIFLRLG